MINLKSKEEIEKLKIGGQKLAKVLQMVSKEVKAGVSTSDLNDLAHELISKEGGRPAFLNFTPTGANRPYPASLCVSINDEIVHGIPNENPLIIEEGDVVKIDTGMVYENLITDHAITVVVGEVDKRVKELVERTKEALNAAIKVSQVGNKTGDIGFAVESVAKKHGFNIVENLTGHGVGYEVHEDPYVPNYGRKGEGETLKEGLVIAIEPMFTTGNPQIELSNDGYTYYMQDGSVAAQFEHTVAITNDGPIVLTKI